MKIKMQHDECPLCSYPVIRPMEHHGHSRQLMVSNCPACESMLAITSDGSELYYIEMRQVVRVLSDCAERMEQRERG